MVVDRLVFQVVVVFWLAICAVTTAVSHEVMVLWDIVHEVVVD